MLSLYLRSLFKNALTNTMQNTRTLYSNKTVVVVYNVVRNLVLENGHWKYQNVVATLT